MKQHKFFNMWLFSGAIILIMAASSAWVWNQLPHEAKVPVHWGLDGQPDRYGSKFEGLFLLPLIVLGVAGLLSLVPYIEPRRFHLDQSLRAYQIVWGMIILFFLILHGVILLWISGYGHLAQMNMILPILIGLLFCIIGNFMGKIRSNFMFGIRTPWTLSSDLAWDKTHRLGGKLMMLWGIGLILGSLFLSGEWLIYGLIGGTFGLVAFMLIYSYLVWKKAPTVQEKVQG